MAGEKKRNRPGRNKIPIDWEEFDKLCLMQCTLSEIADWFKCSVDTIERRCLSEKKLYFAEYFKKKSVGGKVSLRRAQFKAATGGSVPMMIWLGKQFLGQKDKQEISDGERPRREKVSIVMKDASVSK